MDAAIRSVVVGGLQAGVQYRVEVAASTSAGVGVKSEPQTIIIGMRHLLLSITFTVTLHLPFICDGQCRNSLFFGLVLSGVTKIKIKSYGQGCKFFFCALGVYSVSYVSCSRL